MLQWLTPFYMDMDLDMDMGARGSVVQQAIRKQISYMDVDMGTTQGWCGTLVQWAFRKQISLPSRPAPAR